MALAPAVVSERVDESNQPEIEFVNETWRLRVQVGHCLNPYELFHFGSSRFVVDERYCYHLTIAGTTSGFRGGPLPCRNVGPVGWTMDNDGNDATLVLFGQLEFGPDGPTNIRLEHRFTFSGAGRVVEQISLVHHRGRDKFELSGLRFGLRKTLFDRSSFSWRPGADVGQLVPVPLRRYAGQGVDHQLAAYSATDLSPREWTSRTSLPGRSAEAWLWCEPEGGFMVAKYSQDHIEFSVADGEYVVARDASPAHDLQLSQLHSDRNLCLRFGGAAISRGCPERAGKLAPSQRIEFGPSFIEVFDGNWQAGYSRYKELLKAKGHNTPVDYDPQVHWNELYRLGWRCGSNAPLQELPELWEEAARAKAAGAQTFYFDPGWDLFEGSAIWDAERLGPVEDFVSNLREGYGLGLALHLMVHTKSLEEDPGIYRRRRDGTIHLWEDATPYVGGYVCPASPTWQRQKLQRLRNLASAGVSFFMFDFLSYERGGLEPFDHVGNALESCWSPEHGHSVPITREEHAEGIMAVVRTIKSEFPGLTVEAHDRVAGEFLPLYYEHGDSNGHDELWGFEYMWDPYTDLLSGKALSLYEYNLAYDIPLYLHINSAHDSPTMLAFWWYASCCRHLGIGGLAVEDEQWPRLVDAMSAYRRLQPWFARGRFVGLDELAHLHVLLGQGAVLTAFNLTGSTVVRRIPVDLTEIGIDAGSAFVSSALPGLRASEVVDGTLVVDLLMAPLSPAVVEIVRGCGT